jgi:hypothetical protein
MSVSQVFCVFKFYCIFCILFCICHCNIQWDGSERYWTLCFGSNNGEIQDFFEKIIFTGYFSNLPANSSELKYSFEYNEIFKSKSFLIMDNGYLIESCGCTVVYKDAASNILSIRCLQTENIESKPIPLLFLL